MSSPYTNAAELPSSKGLGLVGSDGATWKVQAEKVEGQAVSAEAPVVKEAAGTKIAITETALDIRMLALETAKGRIVLKQIDKVDADYQTKRNALEEQLNLPESQKKLELQKLEIWKNRQVDLIHQKNGLTFMGALTYWEQRKALRELRKRTFGEIAGQDQLALAEAITQAERAEHQRFLAEQEAGLQPTENTKVYEASSELLQTVREILILARRVDNPEKFIDLGLKKWAREKGLLLPKIYKTAILDGRLTRAVLPIILNLKTRLENEEISLYQFQELVRGLEFSFVTGVETKAYNQNLSFTERAILDDVKPGYLSATIAIGFTTGAIRLASKLGGGLATPVLGALTGGIGAALRKVVQLNRKSRADNLKEALGLISTTDRAEYETTGYIPLSRLKNLHDQPNKTEFVKAVNTILLYQKKYEDLGVALDNLEIVSDWLGIVIKDPQKITVVHHAAIVSRLGELRAKALQEMPAEIKARIALEHTAETFGKRKQKQIRRIAGLINNNKLKIAGAAATGATMGALGGAVLERMGVRAAVNEGMTKVSERVFRGGHLVGQKVWQILKNIDFSGLKARTEALANKAIEIVATPGQSALAANTEPAMPVHNPGTQSQWRAEPLFSPDWQPQAEGIQDYLELAQKLGILVQNDEELKQYFSQNPRVLAILLEIIQQKNQETGSDQTFLLLTEFKANKQVFLNNFEESLANSENSYTVSDDDLRRILESFQTTRGFDSTLEPGHQLLTPPETDRKPGIEVLTGIYNGSVFGEGVDFASLPEYLELVRISENRKLLEGIFAPGAVVSITKVNGETILTRTIDIEYPVGVKEVNPELGDLWGWQQVEERLSWNQTHWLSFNAQNYPEWANLQNGDHIGINFIISGHYGDPKHTFDNLHLAEEEDIVSFSSKGVDYQFRIDRIEDNVDGASENILFPYNSEGKVQVILFTCADATGKSRRIVYATPTDETLEKLVSLLPNREQAAIPTPESVIPTSTATNIPATSTPEPTATIVPTSTPTPSPEPVLANISEPELPSEFTIDINDSLESIQNVDFAPNEQILEVTNLLLTQNPEFVVLDQLIFSEGVDPSKILKLHSIIEEAVQRAKINPEFAAALSESGYFSSYQRGLFPGFSASQETNTFDSPIIDELLVLKTMLPTIVEPNSVLATDKIRHLNQLAAPQNLLPIPEPRTIPGSNLTFYTYDDKLNFIKLFARVTNQDSWYRDKSTLSVLDPTTDWNADLFKEYTDVLDSFTVDIRLGLFGGNNASFVTEYTDYIYGASLVRGLVIDLPKQYREVALTLGTLFATIASLGLLRRIRPKNLRTKTNKVEQENRGEITNLQKLYKLWVDQHMGLLSFDPQEPPESILSELIGSLMETAALAPDFNPTEVEQLTASLQKARRELEKGSTKTGFYRQILQQAF